MSKMTVWHAFFNMIKINFTTWCFIASKDFKVGLRTWSRFSCCVDRNFGQSNCTQSQWIVTTFFCLIHGLDLDLFTFMILSTSHKKWRKKVPKSLVWNFLNLMKKSHQEFDPIWWPLLMRFLPASFSTVCMHVLHIYILHKHIKQESYLKTTCECINGFDCGTKGAKSLYHFRYWDQGPALSLTSILAYVKICK